MVNQHKIFLLLVGCQESDSFRQQVTLLFSYYSHIQEGGGRSRCAEQGVQGTQGPCHSVLHSHSTTLPLVAPRPPLCSLPSSHRENSDSTTVSEKHEKMHTHQLTESGQHNPWCRCSYTNKIEPHLEAVVPLIELSLCMQGDIIMEVNTP